MKFTSFETLLIQEAARIALSDGDIFDKLANEMDLADSELTKLRDKLEAHLAEETDFTAAEQQGD